MEEEKLLRFVIVVLSLGVCSAVAQEVTQPPKETIEFAEEAQGGIAPPIMTMLDRAKEEGRDIEQRVQIQGPNSFGVSPDLQKLRDRALNNPRVKALLGADGGEAKGPNSEARYGNDRILLFASFSMPAASLRSLMIEANRFDVPIIMRGFVNNSALDTQKKLQEVFGNDEESIGFGIDPTLFTRFGINSVPQVVVVDSLLGPCETQACLNDITPDHDVVRGNIPVADALRIIADGDGVGSRVAAAALGGTL